MFFNAGLDLAQFYSEATQFYLMVESAEELDITVESVASPVSGTIQPLLGLFTEGVRDILFSCQFWSVQIAA